ncbi:DUF3090 domain-containing protein [Knoellia subterranea]|uniref:Repeat protein (TIGR03847 family) n=1 Tax=Knoellia subterranea KCTC 19937 TaxID=1385521 RepID=A0A0A0JPK7_9MICO|nr:DUF3090 domain-containing protein [Knoellia subterranea]KGN38704.1 hypothetical protein N803_08210 [Knoellia subterranea KCTC 19937]
MAISDFDPPERFVAGTVGPPGGRTFFLQARGAGRLVSVSIEKVQVSILADRIADLLDTVGGPEGSDAVAEHHADTEALETPIEDEFRVDTVSLAWDEDRSRIVIECHDSDPEDTEPSDTVRVVLDPTAARAFARRCQAIVAAGRPPCPFCGQPLDPEGHICPRANGYRR